MDGGAAAAIAALEFARGEIHCTVHVALATLGALIGAVSFSGSCVAFAKLQGLMNRVWRLPAQNAVNIVLAVVTVLVGVSIVLGDAPTARRSSPSSCCRLCYGSAQGMAGEMIGHIKALS